MCDCVWGSISMCPLGLCMICLPRFISNVSSDPISSLASELSRQRDARKRKRYVLTIGRVRLAQNKGRTWTEKIVSPVPIPSNKRRACTSNVETSQEKKKARKGTETRLSKKNRRSIFPPLETTSFSPASLSSRRRSSRRPACRAPPRC